MIDVTDLDLGYEQCSDLHKLLNVNGADLIKNMEENITALKEHWLGLDAKEHINNLISVHDALVTLVTDGIGITAEAAGKIIEMQTVRFSNGGMGQVGNELSKTSPAFQTITKVEDTSEYKANPTLIGDYSELARINKNYSSFRNTFIEDKTLLLKNWVAGANRTEAERLFRQFEENSEDYEKSIKEADTNLSTAVNNITQIMD